MPDRERYRPNVAIILANREQRVLLARRRNSDAWQFPQGGVDEHESPEEALHRELHEEVGLVRERVKVVASTSRWLKYRIPDEFRRNHALKAFHGQRQKWFLLEFLGDDGDIQLDRQSPPEFDAWQWVNYWYPVRTVIDFKRQVYARAMKELAPHLANIGPC